MYFAFPNASSASNGNNTFSFFDDFSDPAWQQLPPLPFTTADLTAATVNSLFYIIGGYNTTATYSQGTVYAFHSSTNTYTQKASMPTARWGMIAVPINGKIYVFGGFTGATTASASTKNEVYDSLKQYMDDKISSSIKYCLARHYRVY